MVKRSAGRSAFRYNVSLAGTHLDSAGPMDSGGDIVVASQTTSPDLAFSPGAVQSRLKGSQ